MERDYGKKNGEKHAGEKKGEGEYLSQVHPGDGSAAKSLTIKAVW